MQSDKIKRICFRFVIHVLAVVAIWALVVDAVFCNIPALAPAGILFLPPAAAGDFLDYVASRKFGIELPYGAWPHVALVIGYAVLLIPVIWRPFRPKWLNYVIPALAFVGFFALGVLWAAGLHQD